MNKVDLKNKPVCVIVGAGPAGLTAASELSDTHNVIILERDPTYVGGISRTVKYKGFRFDLGGHRFFSKNSEIVNWWKNRLPQDFLNVKRISRILYKNKFYNYPLKPMNALMNLGFIESCHCVFSYIFRRILPIKPEVSFDAWVSNRFGDRLFNIFFRSYTEKVWGIPCNKISADWASQRIRGLSLLKAVLNSFHLSSSEDSKTLIETFQYPRLGPGMMWEKVRDDLLDSSVNIRMGRRVNEIFHKDGLILSVSTINEEGEKEEWKGDSFILSMPLQETISAMRPHLSHNIEKASSNLSYRDFITVALMIRKTDLFPDNWIYVHDPEVKVGRIQNFNNWSKEMISEEGTTCLGLEYFCNKVDVIWNMPDSDLINFAKQEIEKIGIVSAEYVFDAVVVRVEKAYPVYGNKYEENVSVLRSALSQFKNLHVVGRNGMHKYNNQDHSMLTALLAARNINGSNYDVWKVNTDAEYQEEYPAKSEVVNI